MEHPAVLPPSDKPTRSQLAGCYGKGAYPTKGAAILSVKKRARTMRAKVPYKCPHCHAWHLTGPGAER